MDEATRRAAGQERGTDGNAVIGSSAPLANPRKSAPTRTRATQAAAADADEEPEIAPTAAVEATRAQEMFVIGTSWPTASKVGASATKPAKGLVLYVYKAAASAAWKLARAL